MTPFVPRVKICGLTRRDDVDLATRLGADALGFIFWSRSPRAVTPEVVRGLVREVPPFVSRVGVFVNMPPADVAAVVHAAGLDVVQLHGDEAIEPYLALGVRIARSVGLTTAADVQAARALPGDVTPIVDAVDPERRGGTGQVGNWGLAAELAAQRPIVLAGGLTAGNIAHAVRTVRPWAVDVSSGVEAEPGVKSPDRLTAFFAGLTAGAEDR